MIEQAEYDGILAGGFLKMSNMIFFFTKVITVKIKQFRESLV
jgi:hypothetical protein